MGYNLQGYIDDVVIPKIMETVFVTNLQPMLDLFNTDPFSTGGPNIVKDICVSETSNAANYTRTDVNPAPDSFETAQASWTRRYQHVAYDAHGIDLSQAKRGGIKAIQNLVQYKSLKAFAQLRKLIFDDFYSRLHADIDSTTAYSDAGLSRSGYPTLASTEDDSDNTVTLAEMRALKLATHLNKNTEKENYLWIVEPTVNKALQALIVAEFGRYLVDPQRNQGYAGGYQQAESFDGDRVIEMTGMTVGDMFYLNPMDVYVDNHRPLSIEQVPSGKDSVEFVMRIGMEMWVDYPGHQSKMTNKD
jgi:hypothetical protein